MGIAILLGLGNRIGLAATPPPVDSPAGVDAQLLSVDAAMTIRRGNCKHPVIPGGVLTGDELGRAVERDRVVAEHYRDVNPSTMRAEILKADRLAYVSYRLGDRVFWTSKKVRIRSGETILTNGQTQIRAGCGNRFSMEPLQPTVADEPDEMQLGALDDDGALRLEAPTDTGNVLVAWALNPLEPLAPGGSEDLELPLAVVAPVGLPNVHDPGSSPGGWPADTDLHSILGALLAPDRGIDMISQGGAALPYQLASQTAIGLTVPGSVVDARFPPGGPNSPPEERTAPLTLSAAPANATPVPEPATLLLLGGGLAGLVARRWHSTKF